MKPEQDLALAKYRSLAADLDVAQTEYDAANEIAQAARQKLDDVCKEWWNSKDKLIATITGVRQ